MILLVDAGNSRLKWAELNDNNLEAETYLAYDGVEPEDVIKHALEEQIRRAKRLIVCSVLGDNFFKLTNEWTLRKHGFAAEFVTTQRSAYGVTVAYKDPMQLGVDRFVALVAAHANYPDNSIVVDCGTAITIDAMTAAGDHLGGVIIPGIDLMISSLTRRTHGIRDSHNEERELFATSTSEAVSGGVYRTVIAAITQIIHDMSRQLNGPVNQILCGGSAEFLQADLNEQMIFDPMLILKGLAIVVSAKP